MAGKAGVNQMWGTKEIEAPILAKGPFPIKGQDRLASLGRVSKGNTPKNTAKWGNMRSIRVFPYTNNRGTRRRSGSPKLHQDRKSGLVSKRKEMGSSDSDDYLKLPVKDGGG